MQFRIQLLAAAALLATVSVQAAGPADVKSVRNTGAAEPARTAADYLNAKTLMPKVTSLPDSVFDYNGAAATAARQSPKMEAGGKGTVDASALARELTLTGGASDDGGLSTDAVGTGGLQFTSSRVSPKQIDKTYPVRVVGKLYFKIGTAGYMCTGSMIKPGVVLTAGHCVHSGNGASTGWYNSFEFIPAYRRVGSKITQPYGDWTNWASATTTIDWFAGGGGVPNTGDWALIVFNKDANNNRIGDYTGWLGWGYPLQVGRHNTILGYPANLDSAGQLHRVDAAVNDYGSLNNGTYGSDMQGGSSGGPNVLNWRVDYTDTSTLPSENWGNIATSVVSWGYVSSTPKVQGGSQFNATFSNMLTTVCTNYAWAC